MGNFWGAPLTPHPRNLKTFKLWQVQLEFSRRPIFDTTSGWAGKNSQSSGLGGLPPKNETTELSKNFFRGRESYLLSVKKVISKSFARIFQEIHFHFLVGPPPVRKFFFTYKFLLPIIFFSINFFIPIIFFVVQNLPLGRQST